MLDAIKLPPPDLYKHVEVSNDLFGELILICEYILFDTATNFCLPLVLFLQICVLPIMALTLLSLVFKFDLSSDRICGLHENT